MIEDAAQLVKANSIQGNKMNDVDVVRTILMIHLCIIQVLITGVHNVGEPP